MTSVSGLRPSPGASVYGAAKAGLINLTQTLAMEWAPTVRVNCVSAGLLDTGAGDDFYGGPGGMDKVAATVPLGRMGTPDDVAQACLFLASPAAGFVSGANLVLDGGGEVPPSSRVRPELTRRRRSAGIRPGGPTLVWRRGRCGPPDRPR